MRKIILLLLIVFVINSDDYDYDIKTSHIYNIYVDKRYKINSATAGHNYFFLIAINPEDQFKIIFRVKPNTIQNFKFDYCPYTDKPSEAEILTDHSWWVYNFQLEEPVVEGSYATITYPFTYSLNTKYLVFIIKNTYPFNYFDILIEKVIFD